MSQFTRHPQKYILYCIARGGLCAAPCSYRYLSIESFAAFTISAMTFISLAVQHSKTAEISSGLALVVAKELSFKRSSARTSKAAAISTKPADLALYFRFQYGSYGWWRYLRVLQALLGISRALFGICGSAARFCSNPRRSPPIQ